MFKITGLIFMLECWIIVEVNGYRRSTKPITHTAPVLQTTEVEYNPNAGHEPYWANGEWVFEENPETINRTTTVGYKVCGEDCNKIFYRIGKVCAHVSDVNEYAPCTSYGYSSYCDGRDADVLTSFVTYDHYCLFLEARCKSAWGSRLVLIHIGACINQKQHIKPIYHNQEQVNRLHQYISRAKKLSLMTKATPSTIPIFTRGKSRYQ